MIDNKLQFYQTRAGYDAQKQAGNIPNDALVFVKDTHEIITHGEEGFGGNVAQIDSRIDTAISGLDANVSKTAGTDGLALSVTEVDGKVTAVDGSIAANTYDSYGSANAAQTAAATDATNKVDAAKTEIIGGATSSGNTLKKIEDRVSPLETAVGTGGSVDSRIATAKSEIIGDAATDYNTLGKLEDAVATETTRAQAAEADRYTKSETYTKEEIHNLVTTPNQEYVSVTATSQTTSVTDVLPATGAADTTYRVGNWDGTQYNDSVFSEYAWNGSAYIKLSTKSQIGEVYDISANHADTKYADLAAALGTNGANVPQSLRKGGMSVKFVQSSDNKYVQYRLIADEWSINTDDWAIADEGIYVENPEFVYVKTDAEGKILWAIKTDGSVYYGAGCPQQVIDYIEKKIADLSLDEYEDIVAFLSDYLGSDTTLKALMDSKLDAEGLDAEALATTQAVENPEFIQVTTDSENKILEGITSEGMKQINLPVDTPSAITEHIDNPEYMSVITDKNGKVISGRDKDGVLVEKVGLRTKKVITDFSTVRDIEISDKANIETANVHNLNLSEEGIENLKDALAVESEDSFDVAKGNLIAFGSYQSEIEASPCINNVDECFVGFTTRKRQSKNRNKIKLIVGMNHDDLRASDYIGHRKIYNKYNFTANFNFILAPFSSVEEIRSMKENLNKMVNDGNTIGLHAIMSGSYWYANRLYDVRPDGSSTFAPTVSDIKGNNQDGTGINAYRTTITLDTTVVDAGYRNLPSTLSQIKVVDLTDEILNTINSCYTHYKNGWGAVGLDLNNTSTSKNNTAWLEYWYNNLIDNTLGFSSNGSTIAEKYAEDYEVPNGAYAADYYPDATHLRNGKMVFFDDVDNPHYSDSAYQKVGRFKKGLFKGCASCCNYEVMDRCIDIAKAFLRYYCNIDTFSHYSRHGDRFFEKHIIYNNLRYMDTNHNFVYNVRGRFYMSRFGAFTSPADIFMSKGINSAHDMDPSITIDTNLHSYSKDNSPKYYTGQTHSNYLNSIGNSIYGNITYQEFEAFMNGLDNWLEYLYNTGGKTVTRNGISFNNFGEITASISLINSCIGTGEIPIFSWDTVSKDPAKATAIDLILRYCYANDIEVVSVAKAKEIANSMKVEALRDNYFVNPTFIQNITRTVGNVNIALPEGWGIKSKSGYPIVSVDHTDNSMMIYAPTQESIEIYTKMFNIPAGSYKLRMSIISSGDYTIKVYKVLNRTPTPIPQNALIGELHGDADYMEDSIDFAVEESHRNDLDLSDDINIICDGYEDNFSHLYVVISCNNGATVKIKDCSIIKSVKN